MIQVATVSLMILATAETSITIIAASIPVLRVLIKNTMRDDSYSTPHFYRYFLSQETQPSHDLCEPPSAILVDSSKTRQLSAKLSSLPSSPADSHRKISPEATASSSWFNSGSESGLELTTHGEDGVCPDRYHNAHVRQN
jgi:hypothetical protein